MLPPKQAHWISGDLALHSARPDSLMVAENGNQKGRADHEAVELV
jgi:hypothetical protein